MLYQQNDLPGAGMLASQLLAQHPDDPTLLEISAAEGHQGAHLASNAAMFIGVGLHTLAMLIVMAVVALIVYRKLGLKILRQSWINFDLIWAVALLVVGATALWLALATTANT